MRVGIIGCGSVGSTLACSLLYSQFPIDVVLCDNNSVKLSGIYEDLSDVAELQGKKISIANLSQFMTTDVAVITAGRKQNPNETREELFSDNFAIVKNIIEAIKFYNGKIIIVTNPVDHITQIIKNSYSYLDIESSGIDIDKVRANRLFDKDVTVKGTHDDSQCVFVDDKIDNILTTKLQNVAYHIISTVGETKYGIAAVLKSKIEKIYQEGIKMKITNTQKISRIRMCPKAICKCQIGQDWYTNEFEVEMIPDECYPDYMDVEKWLDENIRGKELNIEDAVEKFGNYLFQTYHPESLEVTSAVNDASTHFPVKVYKAW